MSKYSIVYVTIFLTYEQLLSYYNNKINMFFLCATVFNDTIACHQTTEQLRSMYGARKAFNISSFQIRHCNHI